MKYFIIGLSLFFILFILPNKVECSFTSTKTEKILFNYCKDFTEEYHKIFLQIGKKILIDYNKKI